MSASAISILVLAIGFASAAATAIALGLRIGAMRADLALAQDAGRLAIAAAREQDEATSEALRRKAAVVAQYRAKVRRLREDLASCGDEATRSALAVDAIDRLLQGFDAEDTDPGRHTDPG